MDCMRDVFSDGVVLDGRYQTIAPLNHGSFGMVFKARDLFTGEFVALKCLTKSGASNACPTIFAVDDRSEELAIHLAIGPHPNIVNLLHSFETSNHIYLVQEFCSNGDLYEAIRVNQGPLETEHVRQFMLELVDAVDYLHSRGIYHRDIKPENILLTSSGSMKLGDFGLATSDKWSYEIAVGSDRYMAPEQYNPADEGYSPAKVDIWAIGICLLNVLFQRNPFATPSHTDPLFYDFANDHQSLFDIFPSMSLDTYEVLMNCLAIDPNKRSLALLRKSLRRVVSFTTDDEAIDEFCNEDREVAVAAANREPLRTPSISAPQIEQSGAFPWARALALSPPQAIRQLSAIPDTEVYSDDLFATPSPPSSVWYSEKPETASIISFVDSGLGLSFKSTTTEHQSEPVNASRSKPVPISGSLPISVNRPTPSMSAVFGKKSDVVSKSWSDLWDEEEEEHASEAENLHKVSNGLETKKWLPSSPANDSGRTTPRGGLVEHKNPAAVNNSRTRSPASTRCYDHRISEHTGFIFEEHTPTVPRYSPPSKRSILDKWAALGDRRRGQAMPEKPAPSPSVTPYKKRNRAGSWRRNNGRWGNHHNYDNGVWERKEWSLSKDWRQHSTFHNGHTGDVGDLEWVGGWHDFHL